MITGGNNSNETTIYNPYTNQWYAFPNMIRGRGYHAMTILSDGSVFTLGGSWSGGEGNKFAEVWTEGVGWQPKRGIMPEGSLVTNDERGIYRSENDMWLGFGTQGERAWLDLELDD